MNTCILDFGAKPEKGFLNTAAIQCAINRCCESGGGRVTVPAGTFLTGSIFLKSNVELHLEHGATLLGSPDLSDYNALDAYPQNYSWLPEEWVGHHLIIAVDAENVSLTGSGTIDGNGRAFFEENTITPESDMLVGHVDEKSGFFVVGDKTKRGISGWRRGFCLAKDKNILRPGQMVVFAECRNVKVRDVTLTDSTCWTLFLHGCENVSVHGIRIQNPLWNGNTDGIDIDCSKNVVVDNCLIHTGDDAITLRGACNRLKDKTRICENITVSNCVIRSGVNGVRVGVGTGTIRNAVFSNLAISSCSNGVEIQSGYNNSAGKGVEISGLRFNNLMVRDAALPVEITSGSSYAASPIRDVTFAHCSFEAFHGFYVIGSEKVKPENFLFNDIFVRILPAPKNWYYEAPPTHFVRIENTRDLRFRSVRFQWETEDPHWVGLLHTENNENFSADADSRLPEIQR